jgi:hypothetical protein
MTPPGAMRAVRGMAASVTVLCVTGKKIQSCPDFASQNNSELSRFISE